MSNSRSVRPRFLFPRGEAVLWLTLAVGALGFVVELARAAGTYQSGEARVMLSSGRLPDAVRLSTYALRLHPHEPVATYTRLVALKRLGRWNEVVAWVHEAQLAHPDRSAMLFLEGEARWRNNPNDPRAVEALWQGFGLVPVPVFSPVALWRMALGTGRTVWGDRDPRNLAAALSVLALLPHDPLMTDADRRQASREAADAFEAANAPLAAESLASKRSDLGPNQSATLR
jgi:hypothetical protein